MAKSIRAIVGKSDQNLASASDFLPHLHVRFAPDTEINDGNIRDGYQLVSQNESGDSKKSRKELKKTARRASNTVLPFERQISTATRGDQFQAARDGNLQQLKFLFRENATNPSLFFNRLDPETKLTPLHYAARFNHLNVCRYLIDDCKVDVNRPGEDSMTPLHYVARFRAEKDSQIEPYSKMIQYLIQCGADINARDDYQSTPLHHACERNNVQCAALLISKNANIEASDRQKMRPLHGASFYGSVESARLLIEHGANILAHDETNSIPFAYACRNSHFDILDMFFAKYNQHEKLDEIIQSVDTEGNTLLHLAVFSANLQLVELLLEKKFNPSVKRIDGQTPIHLCARNDSVDILEKLLEAGGNINDIDLQLETILHKAAFLNKDQVLKCTLEKQTDIGFINKKNAGGLTPLLLAATCGHVACVSVLLEHGADMFADRDKRERGPIHLASMGSHVQTVDILLHHAREHGGPQSVKEAVNEIDRYGRTGLHAAAEFGHVEIVSDLLKSEASLTKKDEEEYTALMLCCKKNRLDVLKLMIEHINRYYQTAREKLNILEERDDGSNTALHIAAWEGHSAIIKLLLEQNCDLQARNTVSWLPIHCAAERGRYNSVRTLIDHHSPIDPIDKNQQTPLHLAARNGHVDVVKFLLKNGAQIDKRTSSGENCLDLAIATNQYGVAETLVNNRDWALILRNAKWDDKANRWDTPLRKLIRKMPDIALIVLNKCCIVKPKNKNELLQLTNKKNKKKSNIIEMEEHSGSSGNSDDVTKDESQLKQLTFIYTYEFLDDQFVLKEWQKGDTENLYEPEGILYPGKNDKTLDRKLLQINHPFTLMVEKKREYLLNHPIVHSLLDYKWKLFARYVYYFNFLFYLFFVASLTTYVFVSFAPYHFGITLNQMQEFSCRDLCDQILKNHTTELIDLQPRIHVIHIFQWLVIALASIQIFKETFQMFAERLDYISVENTVELGAFILAILFTIDLNSCSRQIGYRCVIQWQIGALGVFLSWFALVLFIQKFPRYGIFVVMLTDILRTFSRFFLVFFLFIIGFALAFHMLLQNHNPFHHFGNSLLKTCVMMIGEFEYEGIFHGDNANYFGITYFFFVLFVIVMSIIIMNLLVGLAVDDISSVMRVATVKRLAMRVKLTLDVERQVPQIKFFAWIRRFRQVNYTESRWQHFLQKIFRIQIKTQYDMQYARLDDYGLIHLTGQDQKLKTDDKLKSTTNTSSTSTTTQSGGINTEWITTVHTQISTKYTEFNRHMNDLKIQQEKINTILQQFPTSSTSRHSSHLIFTPATA